MKPTSGSSCQRIKVEAVIRHEQQTCSDCRKALVFPHMACLQGEVTEPRGHCCKVHSEPVRKLIQVARKPVVRLAGCIKHGSH